MVLLDSYSTISTKAEEKFSRMVVFVCLDLRQQISMGFQMAVHYNYLMNVLDFNKTTELSTINSYSTDTDSIRILLIRYEITICLPLQHNYFMSAFRECIYENYFVSLSV